MAKAFVEPFQKRKCPAKKRDKVLIIRPENMFVSGGTKRRGLMIKAFDSTKVALLPAAVQRQ
jgi:hypothetical protein